MINIIRHIKCTMVLFFRGVAFAAALFVMVLFLQNGGRLTTLLGQSREYSSLNDYYSVTISPNIDTSNKGIQALDDALVDFFRKTYDMDCLLFSVGSQLKLYDSGFIQRKDLGIEDCVVTVNGAYLRNNPVYDTDGNVVVAESIDDTHLLESEKFSIISNQLFF